LIHNCQESLKPKNGPKTAQTIVTSSAIKNAHGDPMASEVLVANLRNQSFIYVLQTRRERSVNRGERHYKWKGGRPWERFKNPKYLAWRNTVLERDGYVYHM
jgi:hypothetical protein